MSDKEWPLYMHGATVQAYMLHVIFKYYKMFKKNIFVYHLSRNNKIITLITTQHSKYLEESRTCKSNS